jgi:hypothetical protein
VIVAEPPDPRPIRRARSHRTYQVLVPPPDGYGPAVVVHRSMRAAEAFTVAHERRGWIEGYDGDGWRLGVIWPQHMADADPSWPWWVRRRWRKPDDEAA